MEPVALLFWGVPSAIAGAMIGCVSPVIAESLISCKCRRRGKPEPQNPFPKWVKPVCGVLMAVLTAVTMTAGGVFLGGTYRYQAYFVVAFMTIAMLISLIDCAIHLIPNEMVLLLLGLGLVYRLVFDGLPGLLNGLIALGASILIFGGSSAIFYLIKKRIGLGAGDLKYAFALSVAIGTSGLIPFLCGIAAAILLYILIVVVRRMLVMGNYFPMAAHLSVGFLAALLLPYVSSWVTCLHEYFEILG